MVPCLIAGADQPTICLARFLYNPTDSKTICKNVHTGNIFLLRIYRCYQSDEKETVYIIIYFHTAWRISFSFIWLQLVEWVRAHQPCLGKCRFLSQARLKDSKYLGGFRNLPDNQASPGERQAHWTWNTTRHMQSLPLNCPCSMKAIISSFKKCVFLSGLTSLTFALNSEDFFI